MIVFSHVEARHELYTDGYRYLSPLAYEEVSIIERLFSSSLIALVSRQAPRKLKVCHFRRGTEICAYSFTHDIRAVKLNRAVSAGFQNDFSYSYRWSSIRRDWWSSWKKAFTFIACAIWNYCTTFGRSRTISMVSVLYRRLKRILIWPIRPVRSTVEFKYSTRLIWFADGECSSSSELRLSFRNQGPWSVLTKARWQPWLLIPLAWE